MHPILGQLRRLGFYVLAWIPLGAILLYLLAALGGLSWARAAALAIPLCVVYAFVCLSAWYSCRGTPLETSSFSRLAMTHLSAAVVAGGSGSRWRKAWRLRSRAIFSGLDQQVGEGLSSDFRERRVAVSAGSGAALCFAFGPGFARGGEARGGSAGAGAGVGTEGAEDASQSTFYF